MDEKLRNQKLERLDISDKIIRILEENKINTIEKLCKRSKSDLKKINLQQNEIKNIEVELQLLGLNLKNVI